MSSFLPNLTIIFFCVISFTIGYSFGLYAPRKRSEKRDTYSCEDEHPIGQHNSNAKETVIASEKKQEKVTVERTFPQLTSIDGQKRTLEESVSSDDHQENKETSSSPSPDTKKKILDLNDITPGKVRATKSVGRGGRTIKREESE